LVQAAAAAKTKEVRQQVAAIPYSVRSHRMVVVEADTTGILATRLLLEPAAALAVVALLILPVEAGIPRLHHHLKAITEAAQTKAPRTLQQAVAAAQLLQAAAERRLLAELAEVERHQAYPAHL
jgi:hypothetical protein